MKADVLTKSLLAVIALCLLWLSFQPYVRPLTVNAQRTPLDVVIVGVRVPAYRPPAGPMASGSIPVEITGGSVEIGGQPIDVRAR